MNSESQDKKEKYVDRFTNKILEILMYENSLDVNEAYDLLKESTYFEMIEEDISYVMHYPPKYWADQAKRFQRELVY